MLLKSKKVPELLIPVVVASVSQAWRGSVRTEAQSYLPNNSVHVAKKMPTWPELEKMKGNAANGKIVFAQACAVCHQVKEEGYDFGPKLTEIGSKYPKQGLLQNIVYPSEGISFGYEGWQLNMKDGSALSGIVSSKTETNVDLKLPGGVIQHLKTSDITSMKETKESLMPEGLYENMSLQDLANLLEYLGGLKKR